MSISLGLYDLFGNIIPGLLFLYVLNEFMRMLGFAGISLSQTENTAQLLGIVFIGYVLGHIFNTITYRYWFKLWVRTNDRDYSLERLRKNYPAETIKFNAVDSDFLVAIIQHFDLKVAEKIETSRANTVLLRNVSFGFCLLGLLYVGKLIVEGFSAISVVILVASCIASWRTLYRAREFDRWFYRDIFQEALLYGNSLQEVLDVSRRKNLSHNIEGKTTKASKKLISGE